MAKSITYNKTYNNGLPPQQLSFKKKNKAWRKQHLDWASAKTFFNYSPVRKTIAHKKINYDLVDGKLHMNDVEKVINPERIKEKIAPMDIQHYPIMNPKLNLLLGEEASRVFDYRVVVTNPLAISEIEENKKNEVLQSLQQIVTSNAQNDEEVQQKLQKMSDFFTYEWQDMREIRANYLLNHYWKEYNMPKIFNEGFKDALICGEEMYMCDIVGGEPVIEKLNPLKVRIFRSGYSNKIEDADVIILEDYWSPAKIIDTYYDELSKKDIEYIESAPNNWGQAPLNELGGLDERYGFINRTMVDDTIVDSDFYFDPFNSYDSTINDLLPFDTQGNIRVLRMYWKSRRKIKKIKSYNPQTGEEDFNFYPETYEPNADLGEEETIYYINEAWEGTKIGEEIYINMRPKTVQYNSLCNPSKCHFGIVGNIYNVNDSKPFSLVDMMKPYAYLYDVIHDRLNKTLAKNWGKLIKLDMSKKPKDWDVEKWLYFAKHNSLVVTDSFREGNKGASTGKLAGSLPNASEGVIDAELGNSISMYINVLSYIKQEIAEVTGITPQREGQVSNRETVGGVERATLQSSHITEYLYLVHNDVKRRVLECFLETAKIALKGKSKKFQYLLSDGAMQLVNIEGDEFADSDYGVVIDATNQSNELNGKLEQLAQAALQNQTISFSTVMKLFNSASILEKQRMIEKDEKQRMEQAQQQQQQQLEIQQQQMQAQAQLEQAKMEQTDAINTRDNETKVLVAQITAEGRAKSFEDYFYNEKQQEMDEKRLKEQVREFDKKLELDKAKLEQQKDKTAKDQALKERALQIQRAKNNTKKQ